MSNGNSGELFSEDRGQAGPAQKGARERERKSVAAPVVFSDARPRDSGQDLLGMTLPSSEDSEPTARAAPPGVPFKFDPAKYEPHLAGLDLTESERRAVIESLRTIMESFVAWGFGEDSTIAALNARNKDSPRRQGQP
jgi:hypothetical protein